MCSQIIQILYLNVIKCDLVKNLICYSIHKISYFRYRYVQPADNRAPAHYMLTYLKINGLF